MKLCRIARKNIHIYVADSRHSVWLYFKTIPAFFSRDAPKRIDFWKMNPPFTAKKKKNMYPTNSIEEENVRSLTESLLENNNDNNNSLHIFWVWLQKIKCACLWRTKQTGERLVEGVVLLSIV